MKVCVYNVCVCVCVCVISYMCSNREKKLLDYTACLTRLVP